MRKQHAALKTRLRHKTCLLVFCNYTKCEGHGPKKKHRECNICGLIEGHCFNPQIALLQQQQWNEIPINRFQAQKKKKWIKSITFSSPNQRKTRKKTMKHHQTKPDRIKMLLLGSSTRTNKLRFFMTPQHRSNNIWKDGAA